MGIRMDQSMGLSPRAIAKIDELREGFNGGVVAIPSGETYHEEINDAEQPLMKYIGLGASEWEMVQWLDHQIAEFQRRRAEYLEKIGEYSEFFREYVQKVLHDSGPCYFLGLKNEIHKISAYDWTDEDIQQKLQW